MSQSQPTRAPAARMRQLTLAQTSAQASLAARARKDAALHPAGRARDTPTYAFRSNDPLFVFFDTETTGLREVQNQVVELAACVDTKQLEWLLSFCPASAEEKQRLRAIEQLPREFQTLVRPDVEITAGAFKVHRISKQMVAEAPHFGDAYNAFLGWLQRWQQATNLAVLLVAHNASFDVSVLVDERQFAHGWSTCVMPLERVSFACTLQAIQLYGLSGSKKLAELAKRYVLPCLPAAERAQMMQSHRALADAKLCMLLVQCMPDNEIFYQELLAQKF